MCVIVAYRGTAYDSLLELVIHAPRWQDVGLCQDRLRQGRRRWIHSSQTGASYWTANFRSTRNPCSINTMYFRIHFLQSVAFTHFQNAICVQSLLIHIVSLSGAIQCMYMLPSVHKSSRFHRVAMSYETRSKLNSQENFGDKSKTEGDMIF